MLAKLLLSLLAFASVALGLVTKSLIPPTDELREYMACEITKPRINETWDHDTVFRACQGTLDWIAARPSFTMAVQSEITIVYDMCATRITSTTDRVLNFNPPELAALLSSTILYKCIMGNWWGYLLEGVDYMVSMEPYEESASPKNLEQRSVKEITVIQHERAQDSLPKRDAKRYLDDGELECSNSDRHLEGNECHEAYNKLFDGILWLDHMFIDSHSCRASNSTGNTCTVAICNLSEQGATYHVPQLLDRLAMNISWPCVEWQDKAAHWTDGTTSIFM